MSTLSKALKNQFTQQVNNPTPTTVLSIETHQANVLIESDTPVSNFDLGLNFGLTQYRWTRLLRDYLEPEKLTRFICDAQDIYFGKSRDGASTLMHFIDPPRFKKKHRWGGCLCGIAYRGSAISPRKFPNDKPCLTVFSRTFYSGYIGFLDSCIVANIGKGIAQKWDNDISVRWHMADCQLHSFKSLPYVFSDQILSKKLEEFSEQDPKKLTPSWKYLVRWYQMIRRDWKRYGNDLLIKEKYGQFRRVKEVWMEVNGKIPKRRLTSIPFESLTFQPLLNP